MSQDWTEKYRPKSLSEVAGNPQAVSTLKSWAESWNRGEPTHRVAVLMGSPGIGKTTSAEALARDMGWGITEMNASDQRTADAIGSVALRGAYSNTFTDEGTYLNISDGGMKLIVLDEADSLFGNADRGAVPAINRLIKETRQPVLLIVNDFYALSKKSSTVKTDTLQIEFRKPTAISMKKILKRICDAEGISITDQALDGIAENARGDMRAAVRDLESMALGKTEITSDDTMQLSGRNVRKSMFDLMSIIFRKADAMGSRILMRDVDEEPSFVLRWLDENMPFEYIDRGDLVRGYEKLSRADIFLGRVHRRQYYGMWSYASDTMTAGVCTARLTNRFSSSRFRYPTGRSSRSSAVRQTKAVICQKLADFMHTSTKRVEQDVIPSLRLMLIGDPEIRPHLAFDAGLEPEEIAFLMNSKVDSKAVKTVIAELERLKEEHSSLNKQKMRSETPAPAKKDDIPPTAAAEPEAKETEEPVRAPPKKAKGQRSLFDF